MSEKRLTAAYLTIVMFLGFFLFAATAWTAKKGKVAVREEPMEGACPDWMVLVPAGSFLMGSQDDEEGRDLHEGPIHDLQVDAFCMAKTEVTVGQFSAFTGKSGYRTDAESEGWAYIFDKQWKRTNGADWRNPYFLQEDNHPVTCVTWKDALRYCNWLSRNEGLQPAYEISGGRVTWDRSASGYHLPTEREWEYACRAGTKTPFSHGNTITIDQANYDGRFPYGATPKGMYRGKTTPVMSFPPSLWGLYDMHGNVWEWCWDWHIGFTRKTKPVTANVAIRGGCWHGPASFSRSAYRISKSPSLRGSFIGFRLSRSLSDSYQLKLRVSGVL